MSGREPTSNQRDQIRREGKDGGPNFLWLFRYYVDINDNIHPDLRQFSLGAVTAIRYGRYDVNGFRFRSTRFEDAQSGGLSGLLHAGRSWNNPRPRARAPALPG